MGLYAVAPMSDQAEKAFQKQPTIFVGKKRVLGSKKEGKTLRYWKQVGLGFKTPRDAMNGTYIDKKCPFTGNVAIRRRDYLHYIRKYERFEKRHTNMAAHCSPCFLDLKEGDMVTVGKKAFTKF